MAEANQTFFIPESVRRLRLSTLPLSTELASALRKLCVSVFDDLSGVSLRDFQRVAANGNALFSEIGRLLERARHGDFVVSLGRNMRLNTVSSHRVAPNLAFKRQARPANEVLLEASAGETIFIPLEAHGVPLAMFSVSVRLQHVFEFKHFRLIGDLHGLSFSEIRSYRNCGKKTLDELRELVSTIQHSHQVPNAEG